jgi:uncharacterized protein
MLTTAIILGFAGSLHCAGMCSPLAMAVTNLKGPAFVNRILYNFGRITTYGILGLIVSSIGVALPIENFQNVLSIALGLMMIILAALGMTGIRIPFLTAGITTLTATLKTTFAKFLQRKNIFSMVLLGAINGLLPCGLTFLALSFCVTLASPLAGFFYMFAFGIGTLPVMLGLISIIGLITVRMKWNIKTVTSGLMAFSGVLLIARVFLMHIPEAHSHASVVEIVICR